MTWDPNRVEVGRVYGTTWRTSDELRFLDRIGEHRNGHANIRTDEKIRRLEQYLESMKLRVVWRNLEPDVIRLHAEKLIASYKAYSQRKEA